MAPLKRMDVKSLSPWGRTAQEVALALEEEMLKRDRVGLDTIYLDWELAINGIGKDNAIGKIHTLPRAVIMLVIEAVRTTGAEASLYFDNQQIVIKW